MEYSFHITKEAASYIAKKATEASREPNLNIFLRGGGCSGFSYIIEWAGTEDNVPGSFFLASGVCVFIDAKSMLYLNDSTLSFESTLMGEGLKIINPIAKDACGCGKSISF